MFLIKRKKGLITQEAGQIAEEQALTYLQEKGFKLVSRNYWCRVGEIDLIMRDKEYLVFIEVRARSHAHYGGGAASITYSKKQKIIKATKHYILKHHVRDFPIRFDIISIDTSTNSIDWLHNAFGENY